MAAYVIIEVNIHDQMEYEEYKKHTPGSLVEFGGKFIVRGGPVITLEGGWNPERIVVLKFPSVERATSWWNSEVYNKAKAIRQRAASTKMIVVQGA